MKKLLLATVLAACTTSAIAASTTTLDVKGRLLVSACEPKLSKGGTLTYGPYSLGLLSKTNVNQLGKQDITLDINCPVATKVSWHTTDDRVVTKANIPIDNGYLSGGTVTDYGNAFGVGVTAGNVNIGNYTLYINLNQVVANGQRVDVLVSEPGSSSWLRTTGLTSNGAGGGRQFTAAASGTFVPLAITTATFPLSTSLAIQGTDTLNITDDTHLDGQATITLNYL